MTTDEYYCKSTTYYHHCHSTLQISIEPFNSLLERSLLPSFDFRVIHVTTNSETVQAALVYVALVPRYELPITENFIGLRLGFRRKHEIDWAGVDKEGSFGRREVLLWDEDSVSALNRPEHRIITNLEIKREF